MKTQHSLAVALAILVTHAHAQRSVFEPRIDLRDRAERAEDQRLEMLRLQKEANEELRRQRVATEDATNQAYWDGFRRDQAAAKAQREAELSEARDSFLRSLQRTQELEPATTPAPVREYSPPPKAPTPPLTLRNPNDPNQIPTLQQFMDAHKGEDNLSIVHKYRDEGSLQLLKNGEYDDELMDEINGQLFQHAVERGWIDATDQQKAMAQYFGPASKADAQDASLINLQSLYDGDTAAGKAATLYKALLSDHVRNTYADQAEYQAKLENAKQQFRSIATPDKIATARRAAVDRGDIPFSVVNDSIYLGKEIEKCAGDDAALAKMFEAYPNLDRTLIGAVRKKLSKP
ncbi:MAG: hypothetical protein RLZZ398_1416 [Verrucomicrobiota bacterium]|jgi:hypothetical protein